MFRVLTCRGNRVTRRGRRARTSSTSRHSDGSDGRGKGAPRMIDRAWLSKLAAAGLCCVATVRRRMRVESEAQDCRDHAGHAPAPAAPPRPRQLPADPVTALIETSQRHFLAGERELTTGPPRQGAGRVRPRRRSPARVALRRAHRSRGCASISTGSSIASTRTRSRRSPRATASSKRSTSRPRSTSS